MLAEHVGVTFCGFISERLYYENRGVKKADNRAIRGRQKLYSFLASRHKTTAHILSRGRRNKKPSAL